MRVIPRAAVALVSGAVVAGGGYNLSKYTDIPSSEVNAHVRACVPELGAHAMQASSVPQGCTEDYFAASFPYQETTVQLIKPGPNGDIASSKTLTDIKLFTLPSASSFYKANFVTPAEVRRLDNTDKIVPLIGGGVLTVFMFAGLTKIERVRRREQQREAASPPTASAS